MFDIKIKAINYYIPEQKLAIENLLGAVPENEIPLSFKDKNAYAEFIKDELEITDVRIEKKLSEEQMITKVVEQMLMENDIEPEKIDVIIMAQEHDQRSKENLGQFVQYEFDLENAYVLNLAGNHCANIDYALTISSEMAFENDRINNILILGNVKISDPAKRIVGTYGLLSDGAGAILLSKDGCSYGLKASNIRSAGRLHDIDLNQDNSLLLFKYYTKCLHELIVKTQIDPGDIEHIITQNANTLLITQSLEAVGLDAEKIFTDNKTKYAHLDCLDFLINLKDVIHKTEKNGKKGLILSFGTGWAGSFISSLLSCE